MFVEQCSNSAETVRVGLSYNPETSDRPTDFRQ